MIGLYFEFEIFWLYLNEIFLKFLSLLLFGFVLFDGLVAHMKFDKEMTLLLK